jgi:hypothetical protein
MARCRGWLVCVVGLACLTVLVPQRALAQEAVTPAAAVSAPAASASGSGLQLELDAVVAEREATTRLWPGLMLGTGVLGVVAGATAGIGYIHGCDGGCSVPAWVAIAVVTGAGLATGGAIWLVQVNHDLAQLDMKASMLRLELERYRERSALDRRELAHGHAPQWVSFRLTL